MIQKIADKIASMPRCTRQFFRRFSDDQGGSILILFGLAVVILVIAAGASIDLGRESLLKQKLQNATDAATISTVSLTNNGASLTPAEQTASVRRYFKLNTLQMDPTLDVNVDTTNGLSVSTKDGSGTHVTTSFLSTAGTNTLATSATTRAESQSTTPTDYDVLFVLDVSGSMGASDGFGTSRINAIATAIRHFNTKLLGTTASTNNRIGIVEWNGSVKMAYAGITNTGSAGGLPWRYNAGCGTGLTTCPGQQLYAIDMMQFPFNNQPDVISGIMDQIPHWGGTNSAKGLWYAEYQATRPYTGMNSDGGFRPNAVHVVVLMTDGVNTDYRETNFRKTVSYPGGYQRIDYTYVPPTSANGISVRSAMYQKSIDICNNMKTARQGQQLTAPLEVPDAPQQSWNAPYDAFYGMTSPPNQAYAFAPGTLIYTIAYGTDFDNTTGYDNTVIVNPVTNQTLFDQFYSAGYSPGPECANGLYSPYGFHTTSECADPAINSTPNNPGFQPLIKDLMQNCASGDMGNSQDGVNKLWPDRPQYFFKATPGNIDSIFDNILTSVKKVRITQ